MYRVLTRLITAGAVTIAVSAGAVVTATAIPNGATVSGPIAATAPVGDQSRNYPFGASAADLASHGYVEEEFFFSGTTAVGPYTSRMLVRRPADSSRFSGTVISEWQNVSNGFDLDCLWSRSAEHVMDSGDAYVAIDAQTAGLNDPETGLKTWNPTRYAPLTLPNVGAFVAEPAAYEVFGQALQQISSPSGTNPLGPLRVRQQIATGCSQSAATLALFATTVGPSFHAVDGYLPVALSSASIGPASPSVAIPSVNNDVPVFQVNTETDSALLRQPDSDRYRLWEVAGTTHSDLDAQTYLETIAARDGVTVDPSQCTTRPLSRIPFRNVQNAALEALKTWAAGGAPPQTQPQITYDSDGAVQRDGNGNALGGIRLPEMAVPTAVNSRENTGTGVCSTLLGSYIPFTTTQLAALYSTDAAYLAEFDRATDAAVAAGVLLPVDARSSIDAARAVSIP
jgi:hypothetical protein